MSDVLVTIGIPTYNRADGYLREALSSALAQTYPHLEILVADNCSTDDTRGVVAAVGGDRVTYVRHETNLGAQGNYNSLVERASGEYFLMLHDDDRIDEDFIETCVSAMGERRPGLVRTGTRVIDGSGTVVYSRVNRAPGTTTKALLETWFATKTSFYFCSTLFNTAALRRVGGFGTPKALFNDVAAYVLVANDSGTVEVPEVKATFRQHASNTGKASTVAAWAHDAAHVVDLMTRAVSSAPTAPDEEFRSAATAYFCRNCYHRASRLPDPAARREAFAAVRAALHCGVAPWQYRLGRVRSRLGSRVRGMVK